MGKESEESTSDKVDRVSKKVAKIGGITAGAGLATTAGGLAIAANGAKAAAKTEGAKGVKRMLGGGLAGGIGAKATRLGVATAIGAGAIYGANKLINGGKKKEKSYSATKKGPKFPPGLHLDGRDKNGRIATPAYIDENGEVKELTKKVWKKYRPDINKY